MKPEVNHPSHYNRGKIEAIDFIEAVGFGDGFEMGNAIKYLIRYDAKDDRESNLKKAFWYLRRAASRTIEVQDIRNQAAWSTRINDVMEVYPYLPRQVAECIALIGYAHHTRDALECLAEYLEALGIEPEVDR